MNENGEVAVRLEEPLRTVVEHSLVDDIDIVELIEESVVATPTKHLSEAQLKSESKDEAPLYTHCENCGASAKRVEDEGPHEKREMYECRRCRAFITYHYDITSVEVHPPDD